MVMKKYPSLLATPDDKKQAIYSGLLNIGANMGGPSKRPISFMNQLSQAGQNFGTGYDERIAQSKKDQLGNQQYQMQQAQMELERMKIEKVKEEKAYADELDTWTRMGGKDMYGNPVPEPISPARQAARSDAKFGQKIKTTKPKMAWANVNGEPKLMPESEIASRGLPKYQKSDIKSPDRVAQDVQIAEATAGAKPLTDAQAKSGAFALRMYGATDKLSNSSAGADGKLGTADDYVPSRKDIFASKLPGGNSMVSDEFRLYSQAQDDWISANLRKESGAVIGVEEMVKEREKYFPQPGDKAADVKQKYLSRRAAEAGMKVASGKGYDEMKKELGGNPYARFKVIR